MENLFKPQIIKTFTHQVKNFLLGSKLQAFKAWRAEGGAWIYELRFFPGPKKGLLLGWEPESRDLALSVMESPDDVASAKVGLEAAQDPVQLFVKAHALNRRVEQVVGRVATEASQGAAWELSLQGGVVIVWERESSHGSRVRVSIRREGEKDFVRSLELGVLRPVAGSEQPSEEAEKAASLRVQTQRLLTKAERLVAKVQDDVSLSREGLDKLQALCVFLDADPQAWGRDDSWTVAARSSLDWVRAETRLPAFQPSTRASALEIIHDLRRRYQRKLQGSQKRLIEVSAGLESAHAGEALPNPASRKVTPAREGGTKSQVAKSVLGQWVEHPSGLKARLGRNSRENAQLFRDASSRDVWFHIRGLGGAHVWVPRGQPLFGAKDDRLRDDLELWACQLAVYNSKARHAAYGVVDITEKRHLKAAKGQEGTLLIGRSETRMADLDETFEKWLKNC